MNQILHNTSLKLLPSILLSSFLLSGSPRRRAFQRQRAASETLEPGEDDIQQPGLGGGSDFLLHAKPPQPQADPPRRLSAGSLESSTTGCPPPPAQLRRYGTLFYSVTSGLPASFTLCTTKRICLFKPLKDSQHVFCIISQYSHHMLQTEI